METTVLSIDSAISDCIMSITDFNPRTNTAIIGALRNQAETKFDLNDQLGRAIVEQTPHLLTGSVAELTIRTPLPCFGDSDFMTRFKHAVIIPFGTASTPKKYLRKVESKRLELYSYWRTEFPGYVHLFFLGVQPFDKEETFFFSVPEKYSLATERTNLGKI